MDKEYLRDKYGKKIIDYKGDWNDEYVSWLEFNLINRIKKEFNIKRTQRKK